MKHIFYFLIPIILFSCSTDDGCVEQPNVEERLAVDVISLEKEFFQCQSIEDIKGFVSKYPTFSKKFLMKSEYPDSVFYKDLELLINTKEIKTVLEEVHSVFGDYSNLQADYSDAYSILNHYYPETISPMLFTFVSGLRKDLVINDSMVCVGLDYFIGSKATYKPQNPEYINRRFNPETILPMSMLYVSTKYNRSDMLDKTLLAEMIYYGKSFYFAKRMLPCTPDSLIIGYTSTEFIETEKHAQRIWSYFVEEELLYESSHFKKNKYIGERPNVIEIGTECPGRIGQWLGWKIVNAYMKNNPEITLQELMNETDNKKIFTKSNYKPER